MRRPFILDSIVVFVVLLIMLAMRYYVDDNAIIEVSDGFERKVASFNAMEAPDVFYFPTRTGYIVMSDPPDGCSEIVSPKYITNFTFGKFVLINGTEQCSVKRKILNAEKAGFDLAVIFDSLLFRTRISFRTSLSEINFPVLLVESEDGMMINSNYSFNSSYYYNSLITVRSIGLIWQDYLLLTILFIIVAMWCVLLLVKLVVPCILKLNVITRTRFNGLSNRIRLLLQIWLIPTAKFPKGDPSDVCAICFEDWVEGDKMRILPCSHAYHVKCIDQWLMNNGKKCPLCKCKVIFGDSDDSDSDELASPAENTALLTSPNNQGQSWGTFVNPVRTINDMNSAGPSSAPASYQYNDSSHLHVAQTNEVNPFASDSECDTVLPSHDCCVNACENENVPLLGVQVNTVISCQNSSNGAPIV